MGYDLAHANSLYLPMVQDNDYMIQIIDEQLQTLEREAIIWKGCSSLLYIDDLWYFKK